MLPLASFLSAVVVAVAPARAGHEVPPREEAPVVVVRADGEEAAAYVLAPGRTLHYDTPGPRELTVTVRLAEAARAEDAARVVVYGDGTRFMSVDVPPSADPGVEVAGLGEAARPGQAAVARLEVPEGGGELALEGQGAAVLVRVESDRPVEGAAALAGRSLPSFDAPPAERVAVAPLPEISGSIRDLPDATRPVGEEPAGAEDPEEAGAEDLALGARAAAYAADLDDAEEAGASDAEPPEEATPEDDGLAEDLAVREPPPRIGATGRSEARVEARRPRPAPSLGPVLGLGAPARGDAASPHLGLAARFPLGGEALDLGLDLGWYRLAWEERRRVVDPFAGAFERDSNLRTDVVALDLAAAWAPGGRDRRIAPVLGGGPSLFYASRLDGDARAGGPGLGSRWFAGLAAGGADSRLQVALAWNGGRRDFGNLDASGQPARETVAATHLDLAWLVRL